MVMPQGGPGPATSSGSLTQNLQALSGNEVEIYFGTQKVGYLQDFTVQDSFGLTPLRGIGDGKPQEYVPTMYQNTITAQRAILRKASLFGLMNQQASGQTQGSSAATLPFGSMDGALQGWVFDIVVKQKGQNQNIRVYRHCSFDAMSVQITANAIIMSNVTIHALDVDPSTDFSGAGFQGISDMDRASA